MVGGDPLVSDGTVLTLLDHDTGNKVWSTDPDEIGREILTVGIGTEVIAVAGPRGVTGLDPDTGKSLWVEPGEFPRPAMLAGDGSGVKGAPGPDGGAVLTWPDGPERREGPGPVIGSLRWKQHIVVLGADGIKAQTVYTHRQRELLHAGDSMLRFVVLGERELIVDGSGGVVFNAGLNQVLTVEGSIAAEFREGFISTTTSRGDRDSGYTDLAFREWDSDKVSWRVRLPVRDAREVTRLIVADGGFISAGDDLIRWD